MKNFARFVWVNLFLALTLTPFAAQAALVVPDETFELTLGQDFLAEQPGVLTSATLTDPADPNGTISIDEAANAPHNYTYTLSVETQPAGTLSCTIGTVTTQGICQDGSFEYTPPANFTGLDSFTFRLDVHTTGESGTATVNLKACKTFTGATSISIGCWTEQAFFAEMDAQLAAGGNYYVKHEGFEGALPWDDYRTTGSGQNTIYNVGAAITSKGITWTANHPTNSLSTSNGASYLENIGMWGIFDPDHGFVTNTNPQDCNLKADPVTGKLPVECLYHDGFSGSSSTTLYAVGGYIKGTNSNANIEVITETLNVPNSQIISGIGKLSTPAHQFYGVINTSGFTNFQFRDIDGKSGQPLFIFGDEFYLVTRDLADVNQAPVLSGTIGDQTIAAGDVFKVNIPTVTDPDDDIVTISLNGTPTTPGSLVNYLDGSTGIKWFSPTTAAGVYSVTVSYTDNGYPKSTSEVNFQLTVTTPRPTLNLPTNITVDATSGNTATVDFTVSATDFANVPLTPSCNPLSGSSFNLGTTTVNCTVTDSYNVTKTGSFDVTVVVPNTPPVADAGTAQVVFVSNVVTLDGSLSSDADNDALTYQWSLTKPAGSAAVLVNVASANPTFIADVAGIYTAHLVVNDGTVDSTAASVTITANNTAPVANAGTAQSVAVSDLVTLNGSQSSDANGDALTYLWTLTTPLGSTAALSNTVAVNPTFIPDVAGSYTAQLVVNDGTVDSTAASVTITANNTAPVANAGTAQSVAVSDLVTLNGSQSSDANGDTLSYQWSLTTPLGSTATLSNATAVSPTFTVDIAGSYTAQLVVNDGTVDSAAASVTVTANNTAPVANAGTAQTVAVSNLVTLDGSLSSDANGDTLTYQWSLTTPLNSTATLAGASSVNPTFTPDIAGQYTAQLIVNDGTVDSASTSVLITVNNTAPVANAGTAQTVSVSDLVTLDGSLSSDANGDALTYQWTLSTPVGSTATLSNATAVSPTFTVDIAGSYTAQLVVNDGTVDSAAASVTVTANNTAPVANAGTAQTVAVSNLVTLDGSLSSDANGDALIYQWTLSTPVGSTATLSNATAVSPTFTVDIAGSYTAQLVVNDGTVDSAAASVTVTANNTAPVANAGTAQTVAVSNLVTLDGSLSSDANGDTLTYQWSLTTPLNSTATLTGASSVNPTFTPDIAGQYTAQLIVNDGTVDSASTSVLITVNNTAPVANAGTAQTVSVSDLVTLDGSLSSDANGDALTYQWTLSTPVGSTATLSNATAVSPTFTVDIAGSYTAQLVVNDGTVDSAAASVTVTANNTAPVANAGTAQTVAVSNLVTLDGSLSSDANGDALSYQWSLTTPLNSTATLAGASSVNPTFTPDIAGQYTAQLIVNDGTVDSASTSVLITVNNTAPVANAGTAQTVAVSDLVTLDGSLSSDANGDALTYQWTLTTPLGSSAVLVNATSVSPRFTTDGAGIYTAHLVVNDGTVDSTAASVTITANNTAPVANAGTAQSVAVSDLVTLNGSQSNDPNGDTLTYQWTLSTPVGSTATLSNATSVSPTFTADIIGSYTAQLIVNDGTVDSAAASVTVTANNTAPVANAGTAQTVAVSNLVTLNGSQSSDANGDALTYLWTLTTPLGSTAALSNTVSVNPTFIPDVAGSYTAQLVVNDGTVDSAAASVRITADNTSPVANAGTAQTVAVSDLVTLNGSQSNDPNGDTLTYQWTLSTPVGSTATLSNATSVSPTFTADIIGSYTAQLIVNDGTFDSTAASVTITANNTAPVANAGTAQTVAVSALVTLDGSQSSDANGDALTYQWTLTTPLGSTAALSNATSVNPTFTADIIGSYTAQLIVNDGTVDSAAASVTITANNTAPIANAGTAQTVAVSDLVTLDGSLSSDANGDTLTYQWTLSTPLGSTAALSNATSVNPTFIPDVAGSYTAQLVVNDGTVNSTAASVIITTNNTAPVANAGTAQSVAVSDLVTLNGSLSSDANGDTLTYQWTLSTPLGSTAALSNATSVNPTFTPDVTGSYTAQLVVNDGTFDSTAASVTITANNTAPVANAGTAQTVAVSALVTLDGSQSSDANGDALTYQWTLTTPLGSTAALSNAVSVNPTFIPDIAGSYTAHLVVNDGTVDSTAASVTITANNTAPVANAGTAQSVAVSDLVTLNGSQSSDANGDTLSYQWSLTTPLGSTATLSNATAVSPTFTPDIAGQYTAQLIVNDGTVDSVAASVLITTNNSAPIANAGNPQTVSLGDTVSLNGSASSDPDGDTLSYQWTLVSLPQGSQAIMTNATIVNGSFDPDIAGVYEAQLIVTDIYNARSLADRVLITVNNNAPVANAGTAQSVAVSDLVTLDGSQSSDANGDALSYQWSLTTPLNSTAALTGATSVSPTFTPDIAGQYTAQLIVNDGTVDSVAASVLITVNNTAPVANAGTAQTVAVSDLVTLDGSLSSDANGDALSYQWSLTTPLNSTATLAGASSVNPTFTPDIAGQYTAQLIVNDGTVDSVAASVLITTNNIAPVANAGTAQTVAVSDLVTLDGSLSSDANGDALTYQWTLTTPLGSTAALSNATSVNQTFTPDVAGSYTAQLVVNDGTIDSPAASVTITANNTAPVANAGTAQTVAVSDLVTLNGSLSSDANGDALTYQWTLTTPLGSTAALSNATSVNPTFTPDVSGSYTAQLVVNDGTIDSPAASVIITANNTAPVANAGTAQTVAVSDLVTLDGSQSSDANGDVLTYQWTLTTPLGSTAALSNATSVNPTFTPDVAGNYTAQLVVNDGTVNSTAASVIITTNNTAPVANAGTAQTVAVSDLVTLNGSLSSDANGDTLIYQWTLTTPLGSTAALSNATSVSPTFTPDVVGQYTAQLIVNDGIVDSAAASVLITVNNTAPVANAGPDKIVFAGAPVTLDGSLSSDDNGDALTYQWTLTVPTGSAAALTQATSVTPLFTADVAGTYTAQLIVNDGTIDSAADSVIITVQEPVDVAPTITVPADISVDSTGYLTPVNLGTATATDTEDGALQPTADNTGPFTTGRHVITWSVTDSGNNTVTDTQIVDVIPMVNFQLDQQAEVGQLVQVNLNMNGLAVQYPVDLGYDITVNGITTANTRSIASGKTAVIDYQIPDTANAGDTITFTLTGAINAVIGINSTHTITVIDTNVAPIVDFKIEQNGKRRKNIRTNGGEVTVSAMVRDDNPGDTHTYDWSTTDNNLIRLFSTEDKFVFDPRNLKTGNYKIGIKVVDSGLLEAESETYIRIISKAFNPKPGEDSDHDGKEDDKEGDGDDDNDGIPNHEDGIDDHPEMLQSKHRESRKWVIETHSGLSIRLGKTAQYSERHGANITHDELKQYAGFGRSTPAAETTDSNYTSTDGYFDFNIHGLTKRGQSVKVVIPQLSPIPDNVSYRKYNEDSGWTDFVVDENNKLYSAPGADGVCPSPGSSDYLPGLEPGDYCVQILIQDGGPNDDDRRRNGIIKDPGGLAIAAKPAPASSGGGGGAIDLLMLLSMMLLLTLPVGIRVWKTRHKITVGRNRGNRPQG